MPVFFCLSFLFLNVHHLKQQFNCLVWSILSGLNKCLRWNALTWINSGLICLYLMTNSPSLCDNCFFFHKKCEKKDLRFILLYIFCMSYTFIKDFKIYRHMLNFPTSDVHYMWNFWQSVNSCHIQTSDLIYNNYAQRELILIVAVQNEIY